MIKRSYLLTSIEFAYHYLEQELYTHPHFHKMLFKAKFLIR